MRSCNEYSCSISLLLLLFGVYCSKSIVLLQPLGHCLLFMFIIVLIDYEGIIGEYCCRDRCQQAAHFHNITPTLPGHFFYAAWTSSSSSNCCCHLLLVNLLLLAGAIFISDDLVKSKLTSYRAMGIAGNLLLLSCGCLCAFVSINLLAVQKSNLQIFWASEPTNLPIY